MAELPNIEPIGAGDWIRMMLFSFPGWGKTSAVGTSAEMGRTLIIRSSMDLMPARIMNQQNLEQVVCDTHEALDEVHDFFRMSTNHPYTWVWLDCISIAQDVWLDDIWEATLSLYPHRGDKTIKGGLDRGEYGRNMERIQQWVRHMVGLKSFHFGITAHPAELPHPTNDEGGVILAPWIQGRNMTSKICGYCNIVSFLEVKENKDQKWRRMHFAENPRFYAKDLYDAFLPKGYIDIKQGERGTMPKIVSAVEKARGRKLGTNVTPIAKRGARVTQRRGKRGTR